MKQYKIIYILFLIISCTASASWFSSIFGGSKDEAQDSKITQISQKKGTFERPSPSFNSTKKRLPVVKEKRYHNSTTIPSKHSFDDFLLKQVKENVQRLGGMTKLLFVGDSVFYKVSYILPPARINRAR
jgi:hypothetical protein